MRKIDPTGDPLAEYLIRIGDDLLILGHRLSEWCGHAPILEEDIALANIALDSIGQANGFLSLGAQIQGRGFSADDLAFLRDPRDFKNLQLVEQPNGDFGKTIVRQFLFDSYAVPFFAALSKSSNAEVAGLAGKAFKEVSYHLRHASDWLTRLGLGTEESKLRVQASLDELWEFTFELGQADEVDVSLVKKGLAPDLGGVRKAWEEGVSQGIKKAGLIQPSNECYKSTGSRNGIHTEHLGHLLAEMQVLPRAHPDAKW